MVRPADDSNHFGLGKKATRHNLRTDKRSAMGPGTSKKDLKKQGHGSCNWGTPGDERFVAEMERGDPAYDSCDELFERAFGTTPGHRTFNWKMYDDFEDSDMLQMDEIEAQMESDWVDAIEREFDLDVESEAHLFESENSQ